MIIGSISGWLMSLEILADGNELHFGRDDPLAGVVHLRDVPAGLGAQRLAKVRKAQRVQLGIGEARAPVLGGNGGQFLNVTAFDDPGLPQRREAFMEINRGFRVGVGA